MGDLRLDFCSHPAAKHAVMRRHYSRRMPNAKLVRIGVWESGRFVGAVIYGCGANRHLARPFSLQRRSIRSFCVRARPVAGLESGRGADHELNFGGTDLAARGSLLMRSTSRAVTVRKAARRNAVLLTLAAIRGARSQPSAIVVTQTKPLTNPQEHS